MPPGRWPARGSRKGDAPMARRSTRGSVGGSHVATRLARAAIATVVAVAAACTSSSPPGASPTTGAATPSSAAASASPSRGPRASGPAALYGTYRATIPAGVNAEPGTWTLTVGEGSVLLKRPDGQGFSPGALEEVTTNEIVLTPNSGCTAQNGTPADGRYRWSHEGDALRLEVVSDSCQDRIDTLTASDWSPYP